MTNFLVSCEHGGHKVPRFLNGSVNIPSRVLESHRGYDEGALKIAKVLAKKLGLKLHSNEISRLVIDYNRSLTHPKIWSEYTKTIDDQLKARLIDGYKSYRKEILEDYRLGNIHLSIHSLTPSLNGQVRNCDMALLYDPSRKKEKEFCHELKKKLEDQAIYCRFNYPYRGIADGLATKLRRELGPRYLGIEVEFNQKILSQKEMIQSFYDSVLSFK